MTLSQLLDAFGFEFEQKEGKFFVYDQKDDSFEETADTVKGVINIISIPIMMFFITVICFQKRSPVLPSPFRCISLR